MTTVILLVAILAVGYVSAHYLIGRLQSRFFFTSGIEYIVLGVVLGPHILDIMTPEMVSQLSPVMSLALGSLGLLYGLQLRFRDVARLDSEYFRVAFIEVITTFLVIAGIFALLFWYGLGGRDRIPVFSSALVLGATGAVSATTAIDVVRHHYKASGQIARLLQFVVGFDELLGILLFGFVFCFLHVGQTAGIRPLTTTEWVAVNIIFGIVLGILFFLFLGREQSRQTLLLALIGIVVFASGAAYYLNLSPLFINLVLGIMLANTSEVRTQMMDLLLSVEKPFYVVLLVFAGAAWELGGGLPWVVLAGFVLLYGTLRYIGKLAGGYLAYSSSENPERLTRRVGLGLLSQGGVAVAMVINYQQVYQNEFTNIVVTCVLLSVIVNEFVSPNLTRNLLVDVGEISVT